MKTIKLTALLIFLLGLSVNGQQKSGMGKSESQMAMPSEMNDCMNTIAADSTLRMQMMSRMMENTKGDTVGMMQMCKKMMSNPGMQEMMMNMMHSDGMDKMNMKKDDHMMKPRE